MRNRLLVSLPALLWIFGPGHLQAEKILLETVFGGPGADLASTMLVDLEGNAILVGQSRSFVDTTYGDMLAVKLSPTGDVLGAVDVGSKGEESTRNYIDGEYGGSARTAALGDDGSLSVGAWNAVPAGEYLFREIPSVTTFTLGGIPAREASEVGVRVTDVKENLVIGSPAAMSRIPGNTQFYLFVFAGLF
jgi:hypothetical protein